MTAAELKKKFVDYFVSKGHVEIPPAPLVLANDPSTLFTSSGIQPLVPYFLGQAHPYGKRLVNVQNCVRTGDIDQVGDGFHHTYFEMLGNWSLGDYFKKEMIPWSYDFLTNILKLDPAHLHVTCFEGDDDAPKDTESYDLWRFEGIPESRLHYLSKKDNWWGPPGITGPCGTDTEMFIDTQPGQKLDDFQNGCRQGRIIEVWNDVLIQYYKNDQGKYEKLVQNNIDTGMGVERTLAILSGFSDNYLTNVWQPIIQKIESLSGKEYLKNQSAMRIIADHLRASVFIAANGVEPSNKEAGYVLRRLIRRAIRQGKLIGVEQQLCSAVAKAVFDNQHHYAGVYPELDQKEAEILTLLNNEESKFRQTLDRGLKEIGKITEKNRRLSGREAFYLYQSFGFPVEMIIEELVKFNQTLDIDEFNRFKSEHARQSQTLSAGKFKSGLADNSELTTKYHTATHLLHATLRRLFGSSLQQSGSNITSERLRFDFNHPQKITADEISKIENQINQVIQESLPVTVEKMEFEKAQKKGALAFFGLKYPKIVTVYTIGSSQNPYSREVCTGPHVDNTSKIGRFVITKSESLGTGKQRLYATLK